MMTSRHVRVVAGAITLSLIGVAAPLVAPAADASVSVLCRGYDSCARAGYSSHGYKAKRTNLYWRMIGGHNCTNYAAYLLVSRGLPNVRPWNGSGDAQAWGDFSTSLTDRTPVVGAVAWWDQNVHPAGASGHVAYVEKVISSSTILVSEDNYRGEFYWKRITKSGGSWPSGFIHFKDSRSPAVPAYSASLVSSGLWTDSSKSVAVSATALHAGETVWSELRFRNTGSKTWSGVTLGTTWQIDRVSELAHEWLSPTRVVKHSERDVTPGSIGTFGFAITVPSDAQSSAEWFEHFAPVTTSGTWMLQTDAVIHVVVSDLTDFDARPRPEITGPAAEGATLSATTGEWSPAADQYDYQWLRDGIAVDEARDATWVLSGSDVGHTLTVAVTASKGGYNPSTQISAPTPVVTSAYSDRLYAGDVLASGAQLVSKNGRYQLLQRADGNLMVYDRFSGIPLWASGRTSVGATTTLLASGNLVVYAANGNRLWSSATSGTNAVFAVLGNDGYVRLYTAARKRVWLSYTSGR